MGRTLYAYGDKLWEVSQRFEPTNGARQFTLQPGEYLFMCYGGKGGERGTNRGGDQNFVAGWNYGAAAYGIFTTDQEETMYAMVGGNGNDYDYPSNPNAGLGGFNGGGNGGTSSNGADVTGAGGGGASDIRLSLDSTMITEPQRSDIPSEYIELECIEKIWNTNGCFNTNYNLNSNSQVEIDMWINLASVQYTGAQWSILLGSRSGDASSDEFFIANKTDYQQRASVFGPSHAMTYTDKTFGRIPMNSKVHLTIEPRRVYWEDEYGETDSINNIPQRTDSIYPLYLYALNSWGNADYNGSVGMRVYKCKIYESDVLLHEFVPVKRVSDNAIGFYDVVDQSFSGVIGTLYGISKESRSLTLLSRILVAAGGGGNAVFSGYGSPGYTYGGGKYGSAIMGGSQAYQQPDALLSASQTDGYAFGQGMNGIRKTGGSWGSEGAGGGGGGWFGGYSVKYSVAYSDIPGSGGSSYALTSDSWKPYGYVPTSHYHLTHTSLVPCQSSEGLILICTPVNTLIPEDKIIVPFQGASTKIRLYNGTYDIKCWGAEGKQWTSGTDMGNRIYGGYTEGRLELSRPHDVYAVVGGSGLFYNLNALLNPDRNNEHAGYNGGAKTIFYPSSDNTTTQQLCGGGGTDLRLTMDDTPVHPPIPDPETRDDIPSGYTQLKYLRSDNRSRYFDPGYIFQTNTSMHLDFLLWERSGNYPFVFGADGPSNQYCNAYGSHTNGYGWWATEVASTAINSDILNLDVRVKMNMTPHQLTWESEDGHSEEWRCDSGIVACRNTMAFGALHRNSGYQDYAGIQIYNLKLWEDETLIHDYVPVIRNSDNTAGFLDIVTDSFISWNYVRGPLQTITYPSRSLLSRFIVAGGGGSIAASMGGKGGGTSGERTASAQGVTGGPGTQSASPEVVGHPECNGGFGYGGSGVQINTGRAGCGGGGWYGGSGSHPNGRNANDIMGGNGGSGYVLTADSYKPEYYIPDSEFYISNGVTTLGGNTLTPNMTKIEIDVIEAFCNKLLMYDMEGYKTYDEDQDKWLVFAQTINPTLIEEYGRYDIPNINGMLDEFQVVVDDPDDALTNIEVSSIPLPQSIVFLVPRRYSIGRSIIDAVYDTSIYDFNTNVSIYDDQYNAYTVTIDKTQESDEVLKLYSIMLFSQ